MKSDIEVTLFLKELKRLEQDYEKCESEYLKREINKDIELLTMVVSDLQEKV